MLSAAHFSAFLLHDEKSTATPTIFSPAISLSLSLSLSGGQFWFSSSSFSSLSSQPLMIFQRPR